MRRLRLARTRVDQAPAIMVGGIPAIAAAEKIAAYLRDHGAPGLENILAQPQLSADGAEIEWYTTQPGTPQSLAALNANERAAIEERLAGRLGQIRTLIEAPGTPSDIKQLLVAASSFPTLDHVYAIGREPVLVMWGHQGDPTVTPMPVTPVTAPATTAPMPPQVTAPVLPGPTTSGRRGVLGAVLLLLLLALLTLGYLWHRGFFTSPTEPIIAQPSAPNPDPDLLKELAQERARHDDLGRQLQALQQAFADKLKQCPVPAPEVPVPATPQAEEPPAVPEPPQPVKPEAEAPQPPAVTPPVPEPPVPEPPVVKPQTPKAPAPVVKPTQKAEKPPQPAPPKQQAATPPSQNASLSREQCQKLVPPRKKWEAPEVVFVVDASGSMKDSVGNETRLDAAKESVSFIADHLPADIDTALVKFTDCNAVDNDYFLNRPELKQKVNQLQPTGGTPLARSIERAARILSPTKETVMVVVTDGDDTCRQKDPCEVARQAKASHPNLTINLVDVSGQGLGSCIAQNGGGRVLPAKTPLEIKQAIKDATNQVMLPPSCVGGN